MEAVDLKIRTKAKLINESRDISNNAELLRPAEMQSGRAVCQNKFKITGV